MEELKELLEAVDLAASDLHRVAQGHIAYEKVLLLQAETLDEDASAWGALAEKDEREGNDDAANKAKQRQSDSAKSAQEFRVMMESSKICSAEFTQMHANFAEKEREMFNRIAELERQNAKDSDNSGKNSDMQSDE